MPPIVREAELTEDMGKKEVEFGCCGDVEHPSLGQQGQYSSGVPSFYST
jgi:hypothetical protein